MPSSNPFWFGYYPGDRPIPKQSDQRFPTPQFDMSDMGLNVALDEAIKVVEAPGNFIESFPKQVWEWVKEDWKQSFNVGASPSAGMGGKELYQFGSEEVADVKGVYVQINLFDLATNPKKAVSKFLESSLSPLNPFKAATTLEGEFFTDLATNAEVAMWRSLLNSPAGAPTLPWSGYFRDTFSPASSPINLNEHKIFARKPDKSAKAFSFTVDASGNKIYDTVAIEREVDVYQQVAESHLNFVLGKKSGFTRNSAYRGFNSSVVEAAATELSQKRTDLDRIFRADPTLDRGLSTKIDTFLGEYEVLGGVDKVGKGLKSLGETMAAKGFTDQVTIGDIHKDLTGLKSSADDTLKKIENIRKSLHGKPLELKRFDEGVRELEDYLRRTSDFAASYLGRPVTDVLGRYTQAEVLNSQVAQLRSRFSNNRYGGGVQDRYIESIGRRYFEGSQSLLGQNFVDPARPGSYVLSQGYDSLGRLYDYNKRVFLQEAGRDIASTIGKGKLADQFLWFGSFGDLYIGNKRVPLSEIGMIKDRIQMLTPGYWTKQIMDRTHSFGLVYNEEMKDRVLHPIFNKLPWIIKNEFTEDFEYKVGGVVAGRITARFTGSKDLGNFHKVWDAARNGQLVSSGTGAATTWVKDVAINNKAKIALLNGDPLAIGGGNQIVGITDDPAQFLASMARVRADLVAKLGLDVDKSTGKVLETAENLAKLDALDDQLLKRIDNRALLNPFKEKFGILEIYAHKLSVVQQKIYTKLGLNKVAQAFAQFKTALAQRLTNLVAKLGAKVLAKLGIAALGTATAGLGAVLAPVIEKLIQATIAKVVDKTKELLRAIVKGDFTQVLDNMMNDAMRATEKAIACGCFVPAILVFAIFMMMANIISSISPIDRAKQAASAIVDLVTVDRPDPITSGNCVAETFTVSCNSYETGDQIRPPCRHGDNAYWSTGDACRLKIPYFAGNPARGPASDPTSVCNSTSPKKPYYGYALDVIPADPDNAWVYAPQIGSVTRWDISVRRIDQRACSTCSEWIGCSVTLSGNDGTHNYRIFLLHLACTTLPEMWVGSVSPGYALAKLYNYVGVKHVHIEMMVDGSYVKPEDYMCN